MMRAGATVVMVDRNAKALATLTKKWGGKAIAQVTDLLNSESCAAMIPEILEKVERIDIFYCNAGTYIGGDLVETDAESIDRMLNLNVNAVIKNVHGVLPHMIEHGGGDIIVTSSLAGRSAIKHEPIYSASKFAVRCLSQCWQAELRPFNIRVCQVNPSEVTTAFGNTSRIERAEVHNKLTPKEISHSIVSAIEMDNRGFINELNVWATNPFN